MKSPSLLLSQNEDWETLKTCIEMDSSLARICDEFHMLPLHWACTDPYVPLSLLHCLIHAFPESVHALNSSQWTIIGKRLYLEILSPN